MKTSVCWMFFTIIVLVYFFISSKVIIMKSKHSKSLPFIAENALRHIEEFQDFNIANSENSDIIVLKKDGTRIYCDTHLNKNSKDGEIVEHDTLKLYTKLKNDSDIVTDYIIDEQMHMIAASRIQNEKYFVIAYSHM